MSKKNEQATRSAMAAILIDYRQANRLGQKQMAVLLNMKFKNYQKVEETTTKLNFFAIVRFCKLKNITAEQFAAMLEENSEVF